MNKNILTWVVVLVVIVGGYFLLTSRTEPVPGNQAPENNSPQAIPEKSGTTNPAAGSGSSVRAPSTPKTYNVVYANNAFTPSLLYVKVGDTVVFKNSSQGRLWVASNPHPVHSAYPEFDAKRFYMPGESYFFTFTKLGAWGYHNHWQPSEEGLVIVK